MNEFFDEIEAVCTKHADSGDSAVRQFVRMNLILRSMAGFGEEVAEAFCEQVMENAEDTAFLVKHMMQARKELEEAGIWES